jgi:hypothetical protein
VSPLRTASGGERGRCQRTVKSHRLPLFNTYPQSTRYRSPYSRPLGGVAGSMERHCGPEGPEVGGGILPSSKKAALGRAVATIWPDERCVSLGVHEWRVRRSIVVAARAGDRDAMCDLYERHAARVDADALRIVGDKHDDGGGDHADTSALAPAGTTARDVARPCRCRRSPTCTQPGSTGVPANPFAGASRLFALPSAKGIPMRFSHHRTLRGRCECRGPSSSGRV